MPRRSTAEQAAALCAKALIWDSHSGFEPHPKADLGNLRRWRDAGVNYLSINVGYDVIPWDRSLHSLAAFRAWILAHPEDYVLVGSVADIRRAKRTGRMAVTFDLEGMNALHDDVHMVDLYHALGVRQMLFAYNLNNAAGGGCHDQDIGLTPFGREVVRAMNRVGMLVDCSHSSYRTTMEAMEMSTAPVIFSHSNSRALQAHGRNIRDEQIKACAGTGGVIGINGIGLFLGDTRSSRFVDHVAHVADLVGTDHVGIGLDYAFEAKGLDDLTSAHPDYWPQSEGYGTVGIGFVPPEQFPEIVETMLDRGFAERDVRAILGENFLRVAGQVWK
jgi:membrane dipeptidase